MNELIKKDVLLSIFDDSEAKHLLLQMNDIAAKITEYEHVAKNITVRTSDEDKSANEVGLIIRSYLNDYKSVRLKITKRFDEAKTYLMRHEKVAENLLEYIKQQRDAYAKKQLEIKQTNTEIIDAIYLEISKINALFKKALDERDYARIAVALSVRPHLKQKLYESWRAGRETTISYDDADAMFFAQYAEMQKSWIKLCEEVQQQADVINEAKEDNVSEKVTATVAQENVITLEIHKQLMQQQNVDLVKNVKKVYRAILKSISKETLLNLVSFYINNSIKSDEFDVRFFDKFLDYAAKNGCPQIFGVEYVEEVKTSFKK